jgi:dipeptidyl aminopeptidase/acylaminoacyl peptidase
MAGLVLLGEDHKHVEKEGGGKDWGLFRRWLMVHNVIAWVLLVVLVMLMLPGAATAAEKAGTAFTIKDLLSIKNIRNVSLSADGKRIAFSVAETDFNKSRYVIHIYVVEGDKTRCYTHSDEGEEMPRWSPDGRFLAFLSARPEGADAHQQLWLIASGGGEAWKLTDEKEGVLEYDWMPDGKALIYLAHEPRPASYESYREAEQDRKMDGTVEGSDRLKVNICRVEREAKKSEVIHFGESGVKDIAVSPDGRLVAFTSSKTGDPDDEALRNIWVLSLSDGRVRQVTTGNGRKYNVAWSPDSSRIACLAYSEPLLDFSRSDIMIVDAGSGSMKNLSGAHDIGVTDIEWPIRSDFIYFRGEKGLISPLYRIHSTSGAIENVTSAEAEHGSFSLSGDGGAIAYGREDSRHGPELFYQGGAAREPRRLSNLNQEVKRLASQDKVCWKGAGGRDIEGVLVKPLDHGPGERAPLITIVHGGPYGRVTNTLQDRDFQPLAAQGYAVFAPNYRGSAGYGKDFAMEIRGDLMGKDYEDVMKGIDYIIEKGVADPERLCIMGGSYGGYMTNWAVTHTDRFKAAVSSYGIFSLINDMCNSSIPTFEHDYMGAWYWESLDSYLKSSPFIHAGKVHTPVLILHGDVDDNTFISNSKELYTTLKKMGRTVEFVHYPREGHGFLEPNHLLDAFQRSLEWFNRYIKKEETAFYRLGSEIEREGSVLRIISAKKVDDYNGIKPEGIFIEIGAFIENKKKGKGPLEIRIAVKEPGDIFVITDKGGKVYPTGIPVQMMDENVLIRSQKSSYSCARIERRQSLPIRAAFDLPKEVRKFSLKIKDFPLVPLEVED